MDTNELSNAVADAVVNPAVVTNTNAAAERKANLDAEIARLKAEQESLTKPAAATAKPASKKPVTDCGGLGYPTGATAADKAILDLIHQFKTTDPKYLKPGRPVGTLAVKVHGHLHTAGIPEEVIRAAVESMDQNHRKLVYWFTIPTPNGSRDRMKLYFDYRENSGPVGRQKESIPSEVKARYAAAFGVK